MKKTNVFLTVILFFSFYSPCYTLTNEQNKPTPLDSFYNDGVKFYNSAKYPEAACQFSLGLETARKNENKNAISIFASNLGLAYSNLGDYKKAIGCFNEALKLKKASGDIKTEAFILTNLGSVYDQLGNYEKALINYNLSLEILRNLKDQKGIRTNLGNIGILYDKQGDYRKAVTFYKESLEIAREINDSAAAGETLNNLGIAYGHIGDYTQSVVCYERSLKIAKDKNDRNGAANCLINIGLGYLNLGDQKRSMAALEEALEIKTQTGDKKGLSEALTGQGIVYSRNGNYKKALFNYEKALKIRKDSGLPFEQLEADIADIHLETGRLGDAEKEYRRLGDPVRLGRLELIKKDYAVAVKYFDKLIEQNLQNRNARVSFAAYCGLGMAYSGLKDYYRSRENFEKAILFNEEDRESLSDADRERFFVDKVYGFYRYQPYEWIVSLLVDSGNPGKAFYYSENLKARKFAEAVSKNTIPLRKSLPPAIADEENTHKITVRSLRKTMKAAYLNKDMDMYYRFEKQLNEEKRGLEKFAASLRRDYPAYASINYPGPIKPDEVKLKESEVLVEFEVTDDRVYLFTINDGRLSVQETVIQRKDLRKKVADYTRYFEEIKSTKDLLNFEPEKGKELYSLLFSDALDNLKDGANIIIIPDEFLGMLPFEALVTKIQKKGRIGHGEYGPFPLGVTYLGDRFLVSYGQSATALTLMRSTRADIRGKDTVLLVCDPIFSKDDSRVGMIHQTDQDTENLKKIEALQDWKSMGVSGLTDKNRRLNKNTGDVFPRLEKTKALSQAAESLFGEKNVTLLSDARACESNIAKLDLSAFKYMIFATHGILDETIPWIKEPALVLNLVGNDKGFDGLLTMSEIMGLKISAGVSVLTACQTGVGEDVNGEGVMGLGRAFQYAGSKNVIMSLWPIAEDATVILTSSFLKNIKSGLDPKEALKQAKEEIRKKGFEHPFFWAAFVILND